MSRSLGLLRLVALLGLCSCAAHRSVPISAAPPPAPASTGNADPAPLQATASVADASSAQRAAEQAQAAQYEADAERIRAQVNAANAAAQSSNVTPTSPPPAPRPSIPAFPTSPPMASGRAVLPHLTLPTGRQTQTLGDIDSALSRALNQVGYGTRGYYAYPGGFALATRLEQIFPTGQSMPAPARFLAAPPTPKLFSLDYFRGLFIPQQGYFRVIVFIASDQPIVESSTPATQTQAIGWPAAGANVLPSQIAATSQPPDLVVTAFIYEFRNSTANSVANFTLLDPSTVMPNEPLLDGIQHLQQSGIWKALGLQ